MGIMREWQYRESDFSQRGMPMAQVRHIFFDLGKSKSWGNLSLAVATQFSLGIMSRWQQNGSVIGSLFRNLLLELRWWNIPKFSFSIMVWYSRRESQKVLLHRFFLLIKFVIFDNWSTYLVLGWSVRQHILGIEPNHKSIGFHFV